MCPGSTEPGHITACGHAEVIQLTYDPSEISYEELLEVFWKTHVTC